VTGVAAAAAAVGAFLLVAGPRRIRLTDRVAAYLVPARRVADEQAATGPPSLVVRAGLTWSRRDLAARTAAAAAAGAVTGMLLSQGDLFVAGTGRSLPGLAVLGGLAGVLGLRMWLSTRAERRATALRMELPIIADAIALGVVAGDSVAASIDTVTRRAHGVAVEELGAALDRYRGGADLTTALAATAGTTAEPEAARLYSLLGNAHATGGRLADALGELSRDYRAAEARRLTTEGGKRALATYGPILALMVPTTLLFLMYPTLVGLRSLAGGP
jgi:tight adherence protein C